jgi:hypothetical protein
MLKRSISAWAIIAMAFGLWLGAGTPQAFAIAAPTSLTSCGTISAPGNYVLTKSLTSAGTCFVITVSNVALDLKGHTLTGNGTGDGIDDGTNSVANIAIVNGAIKNFSIGINFPTNTNTATIDLDKVSVLGNASTGISIAGCCNTMTNIVADNNGGNGISIANCCNTFAKIQAKNNNGNGVFGSGCCSFMTNAVVSGNTGNGVDLEGCCSTLLNSTVANNGGDGTFMNSCCNAVTGSTLNGNSGDGIDLGGGYNMVVASKANNNTVDGVDLSGSSNAHGMVVRTQANHNATGLAIVCPGNVLALVAQGNSAANLTEDTSGGVCTNLNNNAP